MGMVSHFVGIDAEIVDCEEPLGTCEGMHIKLFHKQNTLISEKVC